MLHSENCKRLLLLITMAVLTVLVYARYSGLFVPYSHEWNYYTKLGHAFVAGQMHLLDTPPAGLLAAENPYIIFATYVNNFLGDASYYNGKYYLYFGPVPALFIWIPVYLITGFELGDRHLCFFLYSTGTLSLLWLIYLASKRYALSLVATAYGMCVVSFGTWIPLVLKRPAFYEVALGGGYAFSALGIVAFWCAYMTTTKYANSFKLLGSLFLGMAAGSRFFYALSVVIPFLLWLPMLRSMNIKPILKEGILLSGPFLLVIAGVFYYNYARFGSIWESGFSYQLGGFDMRGFDKIESTAYLKNNFLNYFLQLLPPDAILPINKYYGVITYDPVYGLWPNSPFTLWALWFFMCLPFMNKWLGNGHSLFIGITIFGLSMTMFILCYWKQINRYMADFSPWWGLLAAMGFAHAIKCCNNKKLRFMLLSVGGVMASLSVYIGLINAYCGYSSCFKF